MDMTQHFVDDGRVPVIRVRGDLALPGAARLRQDMVDAVERGGRDVVVDLTEVTFVDSTGLGVLVSARTRLTQRGGTLRLVVDSDRVLRTFRISSLIRVFPIHATLDDALSAAGRDRSAGGAEDGSFEAIRG